MTEIKADEFEAPIMGRSTMDLVIESDSSHYMQISQRISLYSLGIRLCGSIFFPLTIPCFHPFNSSSIISFSSSYRLDSTVYSSSSDLTAKTSKPKVPLNYSCLESISMVIKPVARIAGLLRKHNFRRYDISLKLVTDRVFRVKHRDRKSKR